MRRGTLNGLGTAGLGNAGLGNGIGHAVPLWPMRSPPVWRLAALGLLVFVAACAGLALARVVGAAGSLFPANGVALSVLLVVAPGEWLGYLTAAWLGNVAASALFVGGFALPLSLAGLDTLEVAGAAYVLRRRLGPRAADMAQFATLRWFAGVGGLAVPGIGAVLAGALFQLAGDTDFWAEVAAWYASHALGLCITVPLGLWVLRGRNDHGRGMPRAGIIGSSLVACLFVLTSLAIFSQSRYPLLFIAVPLQLWVVVRLGSAGAAVSIAFLTLLGYGATASRHGPFTLAANATLHIETLLLQCYLLTAAAMSFGILALMADRDRLNRAVQRGGDMFRLLAEHASDMILLSDADGASSYVSPACRLVLGMEPQELEGFGLLKRIMQDDRDLVAAWWRRLAQGLPGSDKLRFRARHADGREIWLEAAAHPMREPGSRAPSGYVSVIRDVTEQQERFAEQATRRRELEEANTKLDKLARHLARARTQADEANLAKSRFVASMSHELRTPLNGILGYAQLLGLEGGLTPTQTERVNAMLRSGRHLLELVNNVLDVSQIEVGRMEVHPIAVDPLEVCRACLELVGPGALEKRLALGLEAPADLPRVLADKGRLRQILVNLLGNAVKFTEKGSVTLRVGRVPAASGAATLRFEVMDTGPGVPAAKRSQLFEVFQRLDAASGPNEGAGLGLAISRRLSEMMGGSVGFADNRPQGSIFWLELPVAEAGVTEEGPHEAAPAQPAPPMRLRALVTDDVAMNRDIAAAFLRAGGHEGICVGSGEEAVAIAAAEDFDVILMDVRMPGMDGLEATRQIRRIGGRRGQVPIVALTAHAFLDQVQECLNAGMDAHVVKPFDHTTLLETIVSVVLGHGQPEPAAAEPAPPAAAPARPAPAQQESPPLPAFDRAAYERTAELLSSAERRRCLNTLTEKAAELQQMLRLPETAWDKATLGAEAHTMAGSAGMFGFAQVVAVSRQLERAITAGLPQQGQHASDLARAITEMQAELAQLMPDVELVKTGELS